MGEISVPGLNGASSVSQTQTLDDVVKEAPDLNSSTNSSSYRSGANELKTRLVSTSSPLTRRAAYFAESAAFVAAAAAQKKKNKKNPPKKDPPPKKDEPKKNPPKKDPPKKEEPKKDPPKKDEPKKDPPRQDPPPRKPKGPKPVPRKPKPAPKPTPRPPRHDPRPNPPPRPPRRAHPNPNPGRFPRRHDHHYPHYHGYIRIIIVGGYYRYDYDGPGFDVDSIYDLEHYKYGLDYARLDLLDTPPHYKNDQWYRAEARDVIASYHFLLSRIFEWGSNHMGRDVLHNGEYQNLVRELWEDSLSIIDDYEFYNPNETSLRREMVGHLFHNLSYSRLSEIPFYDRLVDDIGWEIDR